MNNVHMSMRTVIVLVAVPVAIWIWGVSIDVPGPNVVTRGDNHDSASRFEWRFDENLQAEVAFLQGAEHPHLAEEKKFEKEVASSPGMEIEFLPLSRVPDHQFYDQDFAEKLKLGLIIKGSKEPIVVEPQTKRSLLVERKKKK